MARKKKNKPTFVEKDMGWRAIKRFYRTANSRKVDVGVFGNANDFDTPTMAAIASIHEFGSIDGTIPSRSYIRSTFDKNRKKYRKALTDMVTEALDSRGKYKVAEAYEDLGDMVIADIVDRIIRKEIKQDLKHREGTALYDTGELVNSIDKKVTRK